MTDSLALDGGGAGCVWGEQHALEVLAAAGFGEGRVETIGGDIADDYDVATP